MLFNPSLLGFFGPTAYSSLNDSIWSLDSYSCYFGLFFFNIACGLLYPIYFFLGILGSFAFLGHPWPFFLILCSHGLLLTLLDFPDPITLSFIIRAYGFSINPFFLYLRYFGLIVAHSYFSTSHTVHGFAPSLFGLL